MPQLDFFTQAPPAEDKNVRWLESFLNERPGWHTAAEIAQALEGPVSAPGAPASSSHTDRQSGSDRAIRHLAAQSAWIISGQKGYKHLARATTEEIDHFVNWMESQARNMTRRAETVRKNAHRILG